DQRQPRPAGVAAGPRAGRSRSRALERRSRDVARVHRRSGLRRGAAGGFRGPAARGRAAARPLRGRAGEPVEAAAVKLRPVLDAFARAPATADLAERLPARGATLRLGGLAGSSGSVLAAWIANTQPHRQVVVVATTPPE